MKLFGECVCVCVCVCFRFAWLGLILQNINKMDEINAIYSNWLFEQGQRVEVKTTTTPFTHDLNIVGQFTSIKPPHPTAGV